jgi:glycosyltransferase involved in cell wall biosynthesis
VAGGDAGVSERGAPVQSAQVFRVSLDEGLRPLACEPRHGEALLVVREGGRVLGHVRLPVRESLSVERQAEAIARELGARWARRRLGAAFLRAARGAGTATPAADPAPSVSLVVCTRDRPDSLRRCLASLLELRTPPREILVVDNCPGDDRTRALCAELPVRYLREPIPGQARARNRGILESDAELVAFTDDDCVVDPGWLDGLGATFADPLVMAATGYIGPLELETRAQYLFELHRGFEKHFERIVFDGVKAPPAVAAGPAGAGANSIFRRRAFEELGLFAEDLGPGTPARSSDDTWAFYRILAAGYRIDHDPARIVWHAHRRDPAALRRILFEYGVSSTAYATRCLLGRGEVEALQVWSWWWRRHLRSDLARILKRREPRLTLRLFAAEALGTLLGPLALARSRASRRGIPPLALPRARRAAPGGAPGVECVRELPRLSVTIASYDRRAKLARALGALARQSLPPERFEVVVVLDGSADGSAERVRALGLPYPVRVLEQPNRGLAASRNRGAREARHPVVVFLDDDIVAEPGLLAEHARAHAAAPAPHVALGAYPPVIRGRDPWSLFLRAWWHDHFRRKGEVGHVWSFVDFCDGNCSMPRALFLETGGWDEDFRGGRRQDWEYAIRLLEGGVRFAFQPRAAGAHHFDTRFETALRNRRAEGRWDVLLATKHPRAIPALPLARRAGRPVRWPDAWIRAALPALAALDALHLRRRWLRLAGRLLRHAYKRGLEDALPPQKLRELVGPTPAPRAGMRFALDGDAPSDARDPFCGELALELAGTTLGSVTPVDCEGQWDWGLITERVVRQLGDRFHDATRGADGDARALPAPGRARGR